MRCGTQILFNNTTQKLKNLLNNKKFKKNFSKNISALSDPANLPPDPFPNRTYYIPIVFNVLYNPNIPWTNVSDQKIVDQVNQLNLDFSGNNPNISTVPCSFSGLVSKGTGIQFYIDRIVRKSSKVLYNAGFQCKTFGTTVYKLSDVPYCESMKGSYGISPTCCQSKYRWPISGNKDGGGQPIDPSYNPVCTGSGLISLCVYDRVPAGCVYPGEVPPACFCHQSQTPCNNGITSPINPISPPPNWPSRLTNNLSHQPLNVWICNFSSDGTPNGTGILGYSTVPWWQIYLKILFQENWYGSWLHRNDGIVVQPYTIGSVSNPTSAPPESLYASGNDFGMGRTLTHEIGHFLGLFHPWETPYWEDDCNGDFFLDFSCGQNENCSCSDNCPRIPFDHPKQTGPTTGCPTHPYTENACPQTINNYGGTMFMNFMDYPNDNCMSMFTSSQANIMRAMIDGRISSSAMAGTCNNTYQNKCGLRSGIVGSYSSPKITSTIKICAPTKTPTPTPTITPTPSPTPTKTPSPTPTPVPPGGLYAWGCNTYGQLGDNTTVDKLQPIKIGNESNWTNISTGANHSLAINNLNHLYVWGLNDSGQLGTGDNINRLVPTRIYPNAAWANLASSCTNNHSIAITKLGKIFAWGNNAAGQLGDGTLLNSNIPKLLSSPSIWVKAACGGSFTLAIDSLGQLWAWGRNNRGQLGLGDNTDRYVPTKVGDRSDWVEVSAGQGHAAAINRSGFLYCWGANGNAQLGNGNTLDNNIPIQIGSSIWKNVSCGATHTVALSADGFLYAAGSSSQGQIGDGTLNRRLNFIKITSFNWNLISCGPYNTYGSRSNNTFYSWGENTNGQIGDGTLDQRNNPRYIANFSSLALSGSKHVLVIANSFSNLPTPTPTPTPSPTPTPQPTSCRVGIQIKFLQPGILTYTTCDNTTLQLKTLGGNTIYFRLCIILNSLRFSPSGPPSQEDENLSSQTTGYVVISPGSVCS